MKQEYECILLLTKNKVKCGVNQTEIW